MTFFFNIVTNVCIQSPIEDKIKLKYIFWGQSIKHMETLKIVIIKASQPLKSLQHNQLGSRVRAWLQGPTFEYHQTNIVITGIKPLGPYT